MKPAHNEPARIIFNDTIETPIGKMITCSTEKGICLLEFIKDNKTKSDNHALELKLDGTLVAGENNHIVKVKQELTEYFSGNRTRFDVQLHLLGTEFQLAVWNSLNLIPYGTTTTYLKQAISLGKEKAIRAVAAANGQNKIAIIIPCHRVIGTNGKLTGYAGGIERKKWLLEFEKKYSDSQNNLLFDALTWDNLHDWNTDKY